ncbi:hypothetical protein [Paenibacillus glycanilyticus]|uniref:hypothetical protein n=1 Tax=Paenibacillus glycanilyticus TaxID=126569 RepID=UPI001910181D|nr:hypothetical protein [Paenibacillus glycanilyticus]
MGNDAQRAEFDGFVAEAAAAGKKPATAQPGARRARGHELQQAKSLLQRSPVLGALTDMSCSRQKACY